MINSKIIIIGGPTASGKSGLALDLAQELDGIIINADSMQVYKDIPIIAASPSSDDYKIAQHKLYGIYEANVHGNVVDWLELCKDEINNTRKINKTPIIVGGSGMYIDNLINGTTPIPQTQVHIRNKVKKIIEDKGLSYVYQQLEKVDAPSANRLSPNDTTRIIRAYEVYLDTNKPLSYWHNLDMIKNYNSDEFLSIYINPSKEELDTRCRYRFDIMINQGALEEVKAIMEYNLPDTLPSMRALGVQDLKSYLLGNTTLEQAIENAKIHTRQYAKRQTTWFNNKFNEDFCYKNCYKNENKLVEDIKKRL